jgi:hydroxymethylglutaryl-CoA reductase
MFPDVLEEPAQVAEAERGVSALGHRGGLEARRTAAPGAGGAQGTALLWNL